MMMMTFQYPMRQMAVAQQFDGASEVFFQPFGWYFRIGMIIQRFVDTSNGLDILKHCTNIVAYQNDGPFPVDFFQ